MRYIQNIFVFIFELWQNDDHLYKTVVTILNQMKNIKEKYKGKKLKIYIYNRTSIRAALDYEDGKTRKMKAK